MHNSVLQKMIEDRCEPVTETGCWLWAKRLTRSGYGEIKFQRRTCRAHRVSFEVFCGPIPNGMRVLHRCDTPSCVNPKHLFLGTDADNVADKVRKNRQARGAAFAITKLNEEKVRSIRQKIADGLTQRAIAKEMGVCQGAIAKVATRENWKHVV